MKLPGGFSPVNAIKQVGSIVNPTGGVSDYDVFGDVSVRGGERSPANGAWIGPQVQGASTSQPNNPNNAQNGGGGGGGAAADPYARWGGQAAFNARRGQFGSTQAGYEGGARQSAIDVGNEYDTRTRNFLNQIEDSQGEINRGGAQNALNLRTSMANIVRGIQQGIKSGNVSLAGMNALSSGAAEALARAYARVGNQQTGEARGEAATVTDELMRSQGQLNRTRDEGIRDIDVWGDTETGRIRSDFGGKLDLLASQAEGEGIGGVVNRGLVDQVLGEALARLSAIDQSRNQRLAGIRGWTPEEIMAEAIRMEQAGQVGNAFEVTGPDVSYGGNAALNNGAPLGQLPIFVKNKDELAVPGTRRREQ